MLEYSVNGGATWYDILAGNGSTIPANPDRFLQGGYTSTISTAYGNPIGGRQAWSGGLVDWQEVIVDLTDLAGESVMLRWRLGTDSSVSNVGWWVDDVSVLQGSAVQRGRWPAVYGRFRGRRLVALVCGDALTLRSYREPTAAPLGAALLLRRAARRGGMGLWGYGAMGLWGGDRSSGWVGVPLT